MTKKYKQLRSITKSESKTSIEDTDGSDLSSSDTEEEQEQATSKSLVQGLNQELLQSQATLHQAAISKLEALLDSTRKEAQEKAEEFVGVGPCASTVCIFVYLGC